MGPFCGGKDKHNTELVVVPLLGGREREPTLDGKQCFWDIKSATRTAEEEEEGIGMYIHWGEICSSFVG